MCFKPWVADMVIKEVVFNTVEFWVQIYGMPRNRMREVNACFIGLKLGKLLELDQNDYQDVSKRSFLRIRVELDITKPLVAGFPIPGKNMSTVWVQFKNEKLADFCYACGRLGHTQKSCPNPVSQQDQLPFDYK